MSARLNAGAMRISCDRTASGSDRNLTAVLRALRDR